MSLRCIECDASVGSDWIMLTVSDDGELTSGVVCSSDHLVEYAATVKAMELDSEHEGWEDP